MGYRESDGTFVPLSRTDVGGIQYYIKDEIQPGLTSSATGSSVTVIGGNSNPVAAIRSALATWNSISGSRVKFLPLKSTSAMRSASDYQMTVAVGEAEDLSLLGNAIAVTANQWATGKGQLSNGVQVEKGNIIDSDILLNPALTFSTDGSTPYDLQAVMTHELGHALGADHSPLFGATMFPFSAISASSALGQRLLSSDEIGFANAIYGDGSVPLGTIAGKVVTSDGSPVRAALMTFIDRTAGNTLGAITGTDGAWSLAVPAGSYVVYAEPFNSVVGPRNIMSLDPSQVTTGFQIAVLGGASTPTEVSVPAGGSSASVNLAVAPASGALSTPYVGIGAAGGRGDILSVTGIAGPSINDSGNSFDLALVGGGVDDTTQLIVLGKGVSVRAGSTRVDPVVFKDNKGNPLGPLLRATLDVTPRQTPSLTSLLIVKGSTMVSYSGMMLVVPPKPTFVSKGVINSASYRGGANGNGLVSPGGLYTIFGIPNVPNLGPSALAILSDFDAYNSVSTRLGGVTVTFDGVPAPVIFAVGSQLNVQVPFEIAGRASTAVQVEFNGSRSDAITVPVAQSQPGFFTYTGGSDSIATNQDYKLNTAQNPEARGRVVTLYGTGIGKPPYPIKTGQGAAIPPEGYTGNSTCMLNGTVSVNVAFTGWTPTAVGLAQWSLVLPADAPAGMVNVTCTDPFGNVTPPGTLYIK